MYLIQKSSHGKSFIKFLKDSKFCIVNGRVIKPHCDNYTFVSSTDKSVADYVCVSHDCLKFHFDFKVITMRDSIGRYQLCSLFRVL